MAGKNVKESVVREAKGKCVICEKDKKGVEVVDDLVIHAIRKFKKKLRFETGNKLVVCSECMPEHERRRKKFEQSLVTNGGFGVILLIVLGLIGGLNGILYGVLLVVLMLLLTLIVYWPAVKR